MLTLPPLLPTGGAPLPGFPQHNALGVLQGEVLPPGQQGFSYAGASRTFDASGDTLGELQSWARSDIDRWSLRNERFEQDQDQWKLAPPSQLPRNRNNLVTLADPRTTVDKITRIIARHPNVINVEPAPGVDPVIAQKVENWLYLVDRAINLRWMRGLNSPYRYDQAMSAVLRGWITERTMFDPTGALRMKGDPSAMYDHQIIDPACVFPYKAGGKIRRVTHSYSTSVGDMVRDPLLRPFLDPDWFQQDERSRCNLMALYWESGADGGWYHAILGGVGPGAGLGGEHGLWIKPPTELGYNPWTITLSGGAFYRETPWDDQEFYEDVGAGVLTSTYDTSRNMNKMVTRLNELLAQESNPAVSFFGSGGIKSIDMSAGARNYFLKDEKVELHRMGPEIRDFTLLWEILKEQYSRAGLPEAFYGSFASENGFAASVALSAGRDILHPFAAAVNAADAMKYQLMLELYRDFGPGTPLQTRLPAGNGQTQSLDQFAQLIAQQAGQSQFGNPGNPMGGMAPGMMPGMPMQPPQPQGSPMGQVLLATIDVWELHQQGCYVDIDREDMTPQEIAQRINLAMGMVDKQIISRETARKDYVKLKNPAAENVKILSEMVYQNPAVIQMLTPLTLTDTGQHFLRLLWEMTQNAVPGQAPPGQSGAPQSAGGGPFNGSLPTQVTPPAAAGNPLANTRVEQVDPAAAMANQMLAVLTGGAQGGTGAGGTPPPFGSTGFVPQFRPPGQTGTWGV